MSEPPIRLRVDISISQAKSKVTLIPIILEWPREEWPAEALSGRVGRAIAKEFNAMLGKHARKSS